ncbi:hypothetical protein GJJ64_03445 [Pedobacter sp. HX-22-1]|uniref:Uncharacterized protein n=1 Tax=Pedobacter puniceum TaxID=2666136 RepID=A0A7K0FLG5_9SPHI|nr:hypothetical protein [Pedobacter puniceum]
MKANHNTNRGLVTITLVVVNISSSKNESKSQPVTQHSIAYVGCCKYQ